jgi:hypothetical protein
MKKHGNGILYNSDDDVIYKGIWSYGVPINQQIRINRNNGDDDHYHIDSDRHHHYGHDYDYDYDDGDCGGDD